MSIGLLLPFIILIGAMFLMTRSAKNKQRQAATMRNQMEPGSGVRTIGGMYAVVKEVNEDTVLLELADGVHAHFAKNSIGAVLDQSEYDRIVHGIEPDELEDGSEDTDGDAATDEDAVTAEAADDERIDLSKTEDEPKKDGTDPK
ncbi:preprotein translocase subunit YajC [Streptomyces sp. So13.3]|uniref:preprotein translocase subunit YajC n=1 Tax=Streptomyces TaxID=1883 RepID=UPI0011058DAB|nr:MULTISPECIES: preprotein translocase subunit YajC [Streptomyces]MCZ4097513.1 preprotein translocase subunit YajC [Streptomyces sp. H39-C1]QNA72414.1 preprotein translocase subunit YajC [Streptomyces sp. So13.3]